MKGFNKVILAGNLTRDPELRTTPNGQTVASFGLALNRTWKDKDGNTQEQTDFIDCVVWGKAADILTKYVQKGRPLLVSGRLASRSWEQDGQKRTKVEVVVEDFNFISDGKSEDRQEVKPTQQQEVVIDEVGGEPINLDDIPF